MLSIAYTIEALGAARAELQRVSDAWESYGGNNPGKYDARLRDARSRVRQIESALKATGALSLSEQEVLERDLDGRFPSARSKEIVTHNGVRYQRRFAPLERSRSGKTVTQWEKSWVRIDEWSRSDNPAAR